jgi:hypothetical protein
MTRIRLPRRRSSGTGLALPVCVAGLGVLGCGDDRLITLGSTEPDPIFNDAGRSVGVINGETDDDQPSLTEDLLEIYFSSHRPGLGGGDVWFATRSTRADRFAAPRPVLAASSIKTETSPAISRDGLTLWVGSDRDGGLGALDIWRTTRSSRDSTWGPLVNVAELNSAQDDIPRPLAQADTVMPLASRRDGAVYQIYLASRFSADAAFDPPAPLLEIGPGESGVSDPFLSEDGLFLFFSRAGEAGDDLYLAWRSASDQPFVGETALSEVNTSNNDRSPWVGADDTRFFFSSDRQPELGFDVFATNVDLPHFE